jgi:hypothetical protein
VVFKCCLLLSLVGNVLKLTFGRLFVNMATKPEPSEQSNEKNTSQLDKQRSHHRKAFDFLSKALKLDEEEKGS